MAVKRKKIISNLVALSLCVSSLSLAQENNHACSPEVKEALTAAAKAGAERATGIITNPGSGISLPKSVFDLGCLDDIYDMRNINILFNPNTLIDGFINQIKQRICTVAQDYYTQTVSRPFDEAVFSAPIPSIPGLEASFPKTQTFNPPRIDIIPPSELGSGNQPIPLPESGSSGDNTYDYFKNFF